MPAWRQGRTRARGARLAAAAVVLAVALGCAWFISTALGRGGGEQQRSLPRCFVADWRRAHVDGDLTLRHAQAFSVLLEEAPDRLQIVSLPQLSAAHALKITVEPGDHDEGDITQRAELAAPGMRYWPGDQLWLATALYLPRGFPFPRPGQWALLAQLYGRTRGESTGSPPIALEVTPKRGFQLTVRGGSKPDSSSEAPRETQYTLGRASTGVWHEFLLHIRFDDSSTGEVEAWHRRGDAPFPPEPIATDIGENVLTVDGVTQAVFPEVGYYRSEDSRAGIVYTKGLALCPDGERAAAFLAG
jgi:hypothetical protein